jgi:carbon-monoxide dehydrogenase small subunit
MGQSQEKMNIELIVNGQIHRLHIDPNKTLLYLLREDLGLTGAKDGCQVGECGACTVLLDGKPVNSCLVLAGQVDRREVLTIEGLGREGRLHPLQKAFVEAGAVQCGFCIPGTILSAYALLEHEVNPSEGQIRQALVGNLCRCTGYAKIVDAVGMAAEELRNGQI